MNLLSTVLIFATQKHGDQKDKAGKRYILHPIRVMLNFEDEKEQITALLHDVMEDTGTTVQELEALSIPQDVIDALLILTHDKSIDYDEYITKIMTNELACKIKEADLMDNMNLERLPVIKEEDLDRLQKYQRSLQRILSK
ncbi:MAG: hypothetical protein WBL80_02065 [Erysipelotrichaceae bacterium]